MAIAKSEVFERLQIGKEAVFGSLATVNRRLPNLTGKLEPMAEVKEYRGQGQKVRTQAIVNKDWTKISYDGLATYGELLWILASLMNTPTVVAGAGSSNAWTFQPSLGNPDTPVSYSMEQGDEISGYRTRGGIITGGTLSVTRDEVKISGEGIGRLFETGITLTSIDQIDTISVSGTVSGGTYTLSVGGQTTTALAFGASAATVKTALELLSSVGSGNSTITGGALPTTPMVVTLIGPAANQNITIDGTLLTGGGSYVGVNTGGGGATSVEDIPIIANQIDLFLDTTFGGIGTTPIPAAYTLDLALTGRWGPDWVLASANTSWGRFVELAPTLTMKLKIESDAVSDAFVAQYRAATTAYLRLLCTGPVISGGTHYKFQVDVPFKVGSMGGFSSQNGVWAADWNMLPVADAAAGYFLSALLVNKVAAI